MTKADLKDGMIVVTRNGNIYLYLEHYAKFLRKEGYLNLCNYRDDLLTLDRTFDIEFDVMEIYWPADLTSLNFDYVPNRKMSIIWKREPSFTVKEETVEMTISEIEEKLGVKNLKIIKEK